MYRYFGVESAGEMFEAATSLFDDADAVIMACLLYTSSSTFPSKYFDYNGEEIRIYPTADGRFLAAYFTPDFLRCV